MTSVIVRELVLQVDKPLLPSDEEGAMMKIFGLLYGRVYDPLRTDLSFLRSSA